MTKCGLLQFLFLLLVTAASGQKVKYKDIYGLLSTRQFAQAEPFLRSYLRENADNPNAHLFMGNILQQKSSADDILRETEIAIAHMDSAIFHYDKVRATLDDREIKRNKDYYEAYNRRDLRTGEFGVKLSDIQFDLEKRVETLKERISRVKMLKHYFDRADLLYRKSNALFVSLQQTFPSREKLYLRAGHRTLEDLEALSLRFDSAAIALEQYRAAWREMGKSADDHRVTITPIEDFARDGSDVADLYNADARWWDYKGFADHARQVITKEVLPVRERFIARDAEISKLGERVAADPVSVRNEVARLALQIPAEQWKKFDPEPLPALIFGMKATDLEYRSLTLEHRPWRDSADMRLQVRMLGDELKLLSKLDSVASKLRDEDAEDRAADYTDFVSQSFGGSGKMKTYVRGVREFASRERRAKEPRLASYRRALNYIADGTDSIPLIGAQGSFIPLVVAPEEYTVGISLRDGTQQGYFYTIAPSRKADVRAYFPLSPGVVTAGDTTATKGLVCTDSENQIYYVLLFSATHEENIPSSLAKVHRSDGLVWKRDLVLAFEADELVLQPGSSDLIIRNGTREAVIGKQ